MFRRTTLLLLLLLAPLPSLSHADAAADAALAVMDRFLAAFNARDMGAWADTLLYPHVRFAGGKVTVYPDRASFMAGNRIEALAAREGWDHSTWDSREVVQESPTKVHIAAVFSRYRADGTRYASFQSLYIVEKVAGKWGIRARSSFAP